MYRMYSRVNNNVHYGLQVINKIAMANVDLSIVRTNHSDAGFVMGRLLCVGEGKEYIYIYIHTLSVLSANFTMTIKLFLKQSITIQAKVFSIYGSLHVYVNFRICASFYKKKQMQTIH